MALQVHSSPSSALRPVRQHRATMALHPALLMREVAGDAEGVESITIRDDAMRDALVNAGDVIMLQRAADYREGELVAVELPRIDGLRLRRIHFEGDWIRLEAESRKHASELLPAEAIRVRGRVIAIMRQGR